MTLLIVLTSATFPLTVSASVLVNDLPQLNYENAMPKEEDIFRGGFSRQNMRHNSGEVFGFSQASVDINLEASSLTPSVGKEVDVVLTVKALKEYSDARLEIVLPEGVGSVKGDLRWEGSLSEGEEKTLTATVQALEDGIFEILGKMIAFEGDVDRIGKMNKRHLLVGEKAHKQLEAMMEALTNPEQSVIQIAGSVAVGASIVPTSPGTVTIKGRFGVYECRCDSVDDDDCPCPTCTGNNCVANGGASHLHGIPYTLVEAWDDDWTGDDRIASTYTDVNGNFNFANIDNNDPAGGTNEWYLKFILLGWPWFQTDGGDGYTWVQSMDYSKDWHNAYWGKWDIGNLRDGSVHDTGTIVFTDSRKANILYAVMKQCYWMYNHVYGWDMPNVVVFYPADSSYTYSSLYEIYIAGPGKSSYDHAMDDDVVIHEYGHNIMHYYYGTMPRGTSRAAGSPCVTATEGCALPSGYCLHPTDTDLDQCENHGGSSNNCSCDGVAEGWANFVAALVPEEWNSRNWATDRYIVTKDGLVYRDHESNAYAHEYHEMTFARILWDLLDPINDGEDVQVLFQKGAGWADYDENPIWFEMTRQNPGNEHSAQEEPYTLVELWIFWLETFPYGATTVGEPDLCNIYSLHHVTRDFTDRCTGDACGCNGACDVCTVPEPTIEINTDKTTYTEGDSMTVTLRLTNPGGADLPVTLAIALMFPDGSILITTILPLTLPAGLDFTGTLGTFTLPSLPAGTYYWLALLLDPATTEVIASDYAPWAFEVSKVSMLVAIPSLRTKIP